MKFKYIFILVFITTLGFQCIRNLNIERYFPIKQKIETTIKAARDGDLKIDSPRKYLILIDEVDSVEINENLIEIFKFSKTKYDIKKIYTDEVIDFTPYSGVIITTESYSGMKRENFERIKEFIYNGNFLFIAQKSLNNPFNSILGIKNIKGFRTLYGFQSSKEIYPGLSDVKIEDNYMEHYALDVEVSKESKILAISKEKIPLIWEKEYGKGKILYSNTNLFYSKIARGLLKQLIAYEDKIDFSVILNAKVYHIDDFPAPIPKFENDMLRKEYGMSSKDFYNEIWMKDMYAIAKRNKIKYTGFLIGEYNNEIGKKEFSSISRTTYKELTRIGRYNITNNGEVGLHGYNHYSLGLDGEINFKDVGYAPWENIESMKKSLRIVKELYKNIYGEDFVVYSYVAPSNLVGKTGKKAIIETFPSINNFSGVFYEASRLGLLVQEVGRDKDYNEIYSLPRFTAGYNITSEEKWQAYSAIAVYGYCSHFIHPDDIFDLKRGFGKTWDELRDKFENYVREINMNFPYLESQRQMDLVQNYKNIEDLEVDTELKENSFLVNMKNYREPFYACLRISNKKMENGSGYKKVKIEKISGGSYKYMSETAEYTLYLIKVNTPKIEIKLGE